MSNRSLWAIDRNLSGATTPHRSGPGSDDNEGLLRIPQSSSITGASLWDCLVSYPEHSLGRGLTHCRSAVGVFYSSSRLGSKRVSSPSNFEFNFSLFRLLKHNLGLCAMNTVWGHTNKWADAQQTRGMPSQYIYIYIYIYIVIHRLICFVLSELISVARHISFLQLGSKASNPSATRS